MAPAPLTVSDIDRRLAAHSPRLVPYEPERRAAVAIVLHPTGARAEVLFIERAERDGDPWSGHMAFPGGRVEADDPGPRQAAERETREEVGLDLATATPLGRLDDLEGHGSIAPRLVVSAFIYRLAERRPLVLNHEVRDAVWIPVDALLEPARHVVHPYPPGGTSRFPGIVVGLPERQVVWGLTYRFLEIFFAALGRGLPGPA